MKTKILIIEDEQAVSEALKERLDHEGYDTFTANNEKDGLRSIKKDQPDLVLLDLNLPGPTGMALLQQVKGSAGSDDKERELFNQPDRQSPPVFIILTQLPDYPTTVQVMKLGAFDFIPKPYSAERLVVAIKNAEELVKQHRHARKLESRVSTLMGNSEKQFLLIRSTNKEMIAKEEEATRIAKKNRAVLILGKSGTGKDVIARYVHQNSPRSTKPFVAVNSAAILETMIESELFGCEKGAYTGATSAKRGLFERADGGTLFLDEIGDTSLDVQKKLLRVIEGKSFNRVGGEKEISVNVRLIAATNKNLLHEVEQKRFREDLYYRIAVVQITLPLLRERMEDLPSLVNHFLSELSRIDGMHYKISDSALKALQRHDWPGNIRELNNMLVGATARCDGETILPEHLSLSMPPPEPVGDTDEEPGTGLLKDETHVFQKDLIEKRLRKYGGNQTEAAKTLGITRGHLTKLMTKFNIPRGS